MSSFLSPTHVCLSCLKAYLAGEEPELVNSELPEYTGVYMIYVTI